ncbi:MAG: hypothetical protein NTU63_02165 [Candidatus Pacearchaeota archaeon]|nr:hypothetical protein [Candidatus Pacearchaeota archaeon]
MNTRVKRGQFDLSFGMIFSIFLIVVFIAFAVYAIIKFLEFQDTIKIEKFVDDLRQNIDAMWKGDQGSQKVEYSLPTKIEEVCFVDDEYENLIFNSKQIIQGKDIENINTESMTSKENPYCIENVKGKVKMTIVKNYGETLVRITR